tara:strand:- start:43 stop:1107 length:1065 start_codon:yes stop_codon:yes gene_type:complete
MPTDSPALSLLSVISLISFFIVFLIRKYSNSLFNGALYDNDFSKPQAFHKEPVPRCGGFASIISIVVFYILFYLIFKKLLFDYFTLSILIFIIGFLEDIKIKISPNNRLILMILFLLFFIFVFSINISYLDILFLKNWLNNKIFLIFFILICFLFIINGANLVDGFNGLLTIHLIIINTVILLINISNGNEELALIIGGQLVVLIAFLFFNFPKAQLFLGDSGSYLFGSLVALNIIYTNNLNPLISSFFFCVLLFYLFFEVFFSFFRKLYLKKSPFRPDRYHLHMLLHDFLNKSGKFKDCNYVTSVLINFIYFSLILPAIFFNDNGLLCRLWFFSLLSIYLILYYLLYSFTKKY